MSNNQSNFEDEISRERFSDRGLKNSQIGHYDKIVAGRLANTDNLLTRSSGGVITFVLKELLLSGKVDAVATVFPTMKSLFSATGCVQMLRS